MTIEELEARVVRIEQSLGQFVVVLNALADCSERAGNNTITMAKQVEALIIEMRAYIQRNP